MFFVVFYESRFEQKWLRTTFCSHIFHWRKYYTTPNYRNWMDEINVFNSFSVEHEITIKIILLQKTIMYKHALTQFKLSVSWEKKIYGKEWEEPVCVGCMKPPFVWLWLPLCRLCCTYPSFASIPDSASSFQLPRPSVIVVKIRRKQYLVKKIKERGGEIQLAKNCQKNLYMLVNLWVLHWYLSFV